MKKDKLTFIEEKIIEKELKKNEFNHNVATSDPIKDIRAQFAKFRLDKKQIKPDDLI